MLLRRITSKALLLLLASLMVTLSGCSTSNKAIHKSPHGAMPMPSMHGTAKHTSASELKNRSISALDLRAIQGINSIIPALAKHRVVLVGERHTEYGDHLNQLAVLKGLQGPWKGKMAIGLEFVQQPYQKGLDDYIAGRITEREMLKSTQWYDRWVYDFRLYRPIFQFAKAHRIPLIALNIPKEISKQVSKKGIKGLTTQERQQLPRRIDKSNHVYRKDLKKVFSRHMRSNSKGFENFYEAQLAWDEGMADRAAKYLQKHPSQHMVILVGEGHIISRHGIPSRLKSRINAPVAVVLNHGSDTPNASEGDYLLLASEATLPKSGLLGVFMKNTEKGVKILRVSAHGAATKAGIKKDDILVSLDHKVVKTSADVRLLLLDAKPGKHINVTFLNNGVQKKALLVLK